MNAQNLEKLLKVLNGTRHKDYDHTVKMAELNEAVATASKEGTKALLSRFIKRETEDEFNQRTALTNLYTRALWNRICTPFNKSLKRDNANISIEESKIVEIEKSFFGETSMFDYIAQISRDKGMVDPNAFLLLSIGEYDHNTEEPKVTPEIIPSVNALYYERTADRVSLLVCNLHGAVKLYPTGEKRDTKIDGNVIKAVKVDGSNKTPATYTGIAEEVKKIIGNDEATMRDENNPLFVKIGNDTYRITEHSPEIVGMLATPLGYIPDLETSGRTFTSPIGPALPRILSTVKSTSELQISIAMHVFAQKVVQVEDCKGWFSNEHNKHFNCTDGFLQGTNQQCPNCKGTGTEPIAKNSMDVITIRLGDTGQEDRNLDNMVRYIRTDIETPKFLDEYLEKLEKRCVMDVFPSNTFSIRSVEKTATEAALDYENMYDTLLPYVRNFERLFTFCLRQTGQIMNLGENASKFSIQFPDDFEIKTLSELIADYKASEGLPVALRKSIRKKISRKLSAGDSLSDKREAVRILHEPFADKTSDEIKYIIGQNLAETSKRILWANYDDIMNSLEQFYGDSWYNFTFDLRTKHIETKVDEIADKIKPDITL